MADELPYFNVPSYDQYRKATRDQAGADAGPSPWGQMAAQGGFDISRALGYMSPEERKAKAAEIIANQADAEATAADPLDRRLEVLSALAKKFNDAGMTEYVAKVVPEIFMLQQRKTEMAKLSSEAGKAETDRLVGDATANDRVAAAGLGNEATNANIDQSKASAAASRSGVALANADGQNYLAPDKKSIRTVAKGDFRTRDALIKLGWTEYNANLTSPTLGGLGPDKIENREWHDTATAAAVSIDNMRDLHLEIMKNPGAITAPGKVSSFITNMAGQFKQGILRANKGMTQVDLRTSAEGTDAIDYFKKMGIADGIIQARTLDLAYVYAMAHNGNRVTDRDLAAAIQIVTSPNAITQGALLDMLVGNTYNSTMTRAQVLGLDATDTGTNAVEEARANYDSKIADMTKDLASKEGSQVNTTPNGAKYRIVPKP